MDSDLRDRMLQYYDERAPEYEEAYVQGTGTASIPDPKVFQREAQLLGGIVERLAQGRIIDLACGTAYWLPRYAERCPSITLFDQSEKMLNEAGRKATALGIAGRCALVRGDFFERAHTATWPSFGGAADRRGRAGRRADVRSMPTWIA